MVPPKPTLESNLGIFSVPSIANTLFHGVALGISMRSSETPRRVVVENRVNARCKVSGLLLMTMAF